MTTDHYREIKVTQSREYTTAQQLIIRRLTELPLVKEMLGYILENEEAGDSRDVPPDLEGIYKLMGGGHDLDPSITRENIQGYLQVLWHLGVLDKTILTFREGELICVEYTLTSAFRTQEVHS